MEGTAVLVLSRKIGEEIIVDGHIRISIIGLKGDRAKIGITAPPEVPVDRAEIHKKRQEWTGVEADAII
jgi:carbon storage regulator